MARSRGFTTRNSGEPPRAAGAAAPAAGVTGGRDGLPWRLASWFLPAVLAVAAWLRFLLDRAPGTAAALAGFPLDDAWIHMVYARALAVEGGFHYNPGVPETGMTSPLWAILLAGARLLQGGAGATALVAGAKVLALLCGVAGAWTLAALARALGQGRGVALAAASLFALDPALTFSRAAGMEMPLFTWLVLLALLMAARGRPLAAGGAAGLAVVARPEGVVLLPVLAVMLWPGGNGRTRSRPVRLGLGALLAVLPGLLESAFCLHATGHLLPNTFYAKLGPRFSPGALALVWGEYVRGGLPYFALEVGTPLALLGALAVLTRAPRTGGATLMAGFLLFAGTTLSRAFAPGHYHYWERWLVPSYPFLLLVLAAGLGEVAAGFPALRGLGSGPVGARGWRGAGARVAFGAAAVSAAVVLVAPLPGALAERAATFAWNCQNIDELNVATGRWVHANLPPEAVVATIDAGAVRYFGERVTVDLMGLNDHRQREANARGEGAAAMERAGVGWVVSFPWYALRSALPLPPVHLAVAPHYTICAGPQDTLAVYRRDRAGR